MTGSLSVSMGPQAGRSHKIHGRTWNPRLVRQFRPAGSGLTDLNKESVMGFGRGALLWLIGVPLPIIILLALFWRH